MKFLKIVGVFVVLCCISPSIHAKIWQLNYKWDDYRTTHQARAQASYDATAAKTVTLNDSVKLRLVTIKRMFLSGALLNQFNIDDKSSTTTYINSLVDSIPFSDSEINNEAKDVAITDCLSRIEKYDWLVEYINQKYSSNINNIKNTAVKRNYIVALYKTGNVGTAMSLARTNLGPNEYTELLVAQGRRVELISMYRTKYLDRNTIPNINDLKYSLQSIEKVSSLTNLDELSDYMKVLILTNLKYPPEGLTKDEDVSNWAKFKKELENKISKFKAYKSDLEKVNNI